jgi:hypothetical protein
MCSYVDTFSRTEKPGYPFKASFTTTVTSRYNGQTMSDGSGRKYAPGVVFDRWFSTLSALATYLKEYGSLGVYRVFPAPKKEDIVLKWQNGPTHSWNVTYHSLTEATAAIDRMARLFPATTYTILKDSTKSLVDKTAASGHNTKKENNSMNMFSTPVASTPAPQTSVSVVKNTPPPAPVPPTTYDLNLTGLSAKTVARIRKVLENSGVAEVQEVAKAIKNQTGNTGEFYSGLYVDRHFDGSIRFRNK